jgi:hypothetical protein
MKIVPILITALVLPVSAWAANNANAARLTEPNTAPPAEANAPAEQIPDVQTMVEKANIVAYYHGNDGKAKVHMEIINKQGQTRERDFVILRKDEKDGGDQKYYVYFRRPADVRGMVFMVHKQAGWKNDDDRWLYLPALDLVKRIAAGDKRTSFAGSDYLYEDVSGRSLDADTHELKDSGDQYFVVRNTPKDPDMVEFSYYDASIDRTTFLPMKMEYYDKDGNLYRVIEVQEVQEIQGFPTPVKSVVHNLEAESKTVMTYSDVQYNIDLANIFEERYLRRPPSEALR